MYCIKSGLNKKRFLRSSATLKLNSSSFFKNLLLKKRFFKNTNISCNQILTYSLRARSRSGFRTKSGEIVLNSTSNKKNFEQMKTINQIRKQIGRKTKKLFAPERNVLRLRNGEPSSIGYRRKHRVFCIKNKGELPKAKKKSLPYYNESLNKLFQAKR